MSEIASKPMTYGRLREVLTDLGFVKKDGKDFVAYDNAGWKALVVLPVTSPDETLNTWHLLAVRKAITEKRVASAETLERSLKKPRGRLLGRVTETSSG
jgi:hypothetical protein